MIIFAMKLAVSEFSNKSEQLTLSLTLSTTRIDTTCFDSRAGLSRVERPAL